MPNRRYISGRTFEYATQRKYESLGYVTCRSAGSHSPADVLAFRPDRPPVLIQCKVVSKPFQVQSEHKKFLKTTTPSKFYIQTLEVKLKGTTAPHTFTT